jgi:hypothetical protein
VDTAEVRTSIESELADLRESVIKALSALGSAVSDARSLVESGVEYDQRADVMVERQEALRRALRARRPRG